MIIPPLPWGENRPEQERIAQTMRDSVLSGQHAIVEAGTGVGKTLAALFAVKPVLERGGTVVYSTHTKGLQGQLWSKDLPLYREITGMPLPSAVIKGKSNYVCLQDLFGLGEDVFFASDSNYRAVLDWAKDPQNSGDRESVPVPITWFDEIAVKPETCRRSHCPLYSQCKYYALRNMLYHANIIVVNHALYLSAMALDEDNFFPSHDVVIFDEAHHIESAATDSFGVTFSSHEISRLVDRVIRWHVKSTPMSLIQDIYQTNIALFHMMEMVRSGMKLEEALGGRLSNYHSMLQFLIRLLSVFKEHFEGVLSEQNQYISGHIESGIKYCENISERLSLFLSPCPEGSVRYVQTNGNILTIYQSPIEVSEHLEAFVWNRKETTSILMSATLSTDGHFRFLRSRLGIGESHRVVERIESSPFPFDKNACLYVPPLPEPPSGDTLSDRWLDMCYNEIIGLHRVMGGGMFVLCTSKKAMNYHAERLKRDNIEFKKQGDAPVPELVSWFKEHGDALVLGLSTFWEGVDVQGDALRCVVIDRLPFTAPDDPLHSARVDMIRQKGGDWFNDYALPSCQMKMKQGFGRLIRSKTDRGVVAVLDSRICTKGYGKLILSSLPKTYFSRRLDEVESWWRDQKRERS